VDGSRETILAAVVRSGGRCMTQAPQGICKVQEVLTDICHTFLKLNRLLDVLPPRHIHSFRSPRSVLILYCTSEHGMAYENAMWLDLGACVMKLAVMWRSTQKESRMSDSKVARSFVVLTGYTSITASHKGCVSVDRQSTFMYLFRCLIEMEKSAAYVPYSKPVLS
jgi:hypothetical protein